MGFYLRKSIRFGPFRFNLSKSGMGMSTGLKGLRVGSGPRGNYVHMGRGGLYYRHTLPPAGEGVPKVKDSEMQPWQVVDALQDIHTANISELANSSSAQLLETIAKKRKRIRVWPGVGVLTLLAPGFFNAHFSSYWLTMVVGFLGVVATAGAYWYDRVSKTFVMMYNLEEGECTDRVEALHAAFENMCRCEMKWRIEAQGGSGDWKRNAGARHVIRRKSVDIKVKCPPYIKTNIPVFSLPAGPQMLYFFPDRILVYEGNVVGAIRYDQFSVTRGETQFIEEDRMPSDSLVARYTWKYVNRDGGPDKRFNSNRRIPVAWYEEVVFTSTTGLRIMYHFSRSKSAVPLAQALVAMR